VTEQEQQTGKYGKGAPYDHKFKAGNLGDVLKHCAMLAWIDALGDVPRWICDTHAGAGMHAVQRQGEWNFGVGKLDVLDLSGAPAAVQRYMAAAQGKRTPDKGGLYPGSPALLRATLREGDRLTLCELADEPRARIESFYASDDLVDVRDGDGLATLCSIDAGDRQLAAFIDPPFVRKDEWTQVAQAAIAVARAHPTATLAIWYPIKSLKRPQVLSAAIREAGIRAATVDLITTPLRLKRRALNGSGLLFIRPPAGLVSTLGGALPWLGEALAHQTAQEWTLNLRSWRGKPQTADEPETADSAPAGAAVAPVEVE
jgi:23S rRNA (adenine2030-N6)-methyltransferase